MEEHELHLKLPASRKLAYGVGDLGANLVLNAVSFYFLYYLTDVALLGASLAGLVLTLVRVVDACIDPGIGYWSDRTRSRWGRRRPFILFGAIPMGVILLLLFSGSPLPGEAGMFFYYLLIYTLFCISYSLVNVPYSALTPDLTKDFDERTSLNGYRMAAAIVGTLIAAGATKPLVGLFPSERLGFPIVAAAYGLIFVGVSLIVFWGSRGHDRSVAEGRKEAISSLYLAALRNKPFMLVTVSYILHSVAVTMISASLVYYLKYYLRQEALLSPTFLVLLLTAMVCIPFWVWVSKRAGKKAAYLAGMSIFVAGLLLLFFLQPGQVSGIYLLAALTGSGLSTFFVLPWAIVPDTIELHERRTGQRIEGIFYGIWNFGPQLAGSLAGLAIGLGLDLAGYIPNVAQQSPSALLGIRIVFCLLPALLALLGIGIMSFYPISKQSYDRLVGGRGE